MENVILKYITSNLLSNFGTFDADTDITMFLNDIISDYGYENLIKHEIFLTNDNRFRIGALVKIPEKTKNETKQKRVMIK